MICGNSWSRSPGVNAGRFKREVQLAARLRHPHIVPVLTTGEVDGLPYYIMPFVKGESLNGRLETSSRSRELDIGRLREKLGETQLAVDAHAYVLNAWQNTDSEQLKNAVKESRDALKRVDSDGRVRAQLANPR